MTQADPGADETTPAQPQRVRRRVADPDVKVEDPERKGCMRLAMFLGIGAGVVAAIFVLPWALNFFFQPEEVGVGETFEHEGLELTVLSVSPAGDDEWEVVLRASRHEAWTAGADDFVLHFPGGAEAPLLGDESPARQVPGGGEPVELVLRFASPAGVDEAPEQLVLDNPQVEFDLPEPNIP